MSGIPPEEAAELRKQWIEKRMDLVERSQAAEGLTLKRYVVGTLVGVAAVLFALWALENF